MNMSLHEQKQRWYRWHLHWAWVLNSLGSQKSLLDLWENSVLLFWRKQSEVFGRNTYRGWTTRRQLEIFRFGVSYIQIRMKLFKLHLNIQKKSMMVKEKYLIKPDMNFLKKSCSWSKFPKWNGVWKEYDDSGRNVMTQDSNQLQSAPEPIIRP